MGGARVVPGRHAAQRTTTGCIASRHICQAATHWPQRDGGSAGTVCNSRYKGTLENSKTAPPPGHKVVVEVRHVQVLQAQLRLPAGWWVEGSVVDERREGHLGEWAPGSACASHATSAAIRECLCIARH